MSYRDHRHSITVD